ncbi:MAG: GTPase [Candidatus Altiarchaeota archaeon]
MFKLPYIPTSDELIEKSFRKGSKEHKKKISAGKKKRFKEQRAEEERVRTVEKIICSDLDAIVKNFPSYERLDTFYQRLLDIKVNKDVFKKSLGAVQWCSTSLKRLTNTSLRELRKTGDSAPSKRFLGRVSSFVKQIGPDLDTLIEIKGILQDFPVVKDFPTLVIAGYPNVGKSTFLRNLTGSKVEIDSYPFTTKRIQMGYRNIKYKNVQLIDLPGLLDRPMAERNKIEQEALLAIGELADVILFILDPTENVGQQISLLIEVQKTFEQKIFVCVNKTDAVGVDVLEKIFDQLKDYAPLRMSALDQADCIRVFEKIMG